MPKLDSTIEELESPKHRRCNLVSFNGIITASTIKIFRKALDGFKDSGLDLLVDIGSVHYINSTGLGAFVKVREDLALKNCNLMLVGMRKDIRQLMDMLGLGEILNIYKDISEALDALDNEIIVPSPIKVEGSKSKEKKGTFIPVDTPEPILPNANIVLGMKNDNHFTKLLRRCFSGDNSEKMALAPTRNEFAKRLAKGKIDIAILDSSLPDFQQICTLLKTDVENGLVSIITMYSNELDQRTEDSFRIIEDEYVVEPCEVRELMSIIEREYSRCKEEEIFFRKEAEFDFKADEKHVAEATNRIENMLASVEMDQSAKDSFIYAIREAIDNARKHGNTATAEKRIGVLYILDKEKLTISVQDEGDGFDFRKVIADATNNTPIQQAKKRQAEGGHGGLGMSLMLRCCDKVEYLEPGNVVKLTKYL
jgi:anti-anti-sigma factor